MTDARRAIDAGDAAREGVAMSLPVQSWVSDKGLPPDGATLRHIGPEPDLELYDRKPRDGGLWTSTWDPVARTSGWIEWFRSEHFRGPVATPPLTRRV